MFGWLGGWWLRLIYIERKPPRARYCCRWLRRQLQLVVVAAPQNSTQFVK